MAVTPRKPVTNDAGKEEAFAKERASALKVFNSYNKTLKDADRMFSDLTKSAGSSIRAYTDFVKTMRSLTDKFSKMSYALERSGQGNLLNSFLGNRSISGARARLGTYAQYASERILQSNWKDAQDRGQDRLDTIIRRSRSRLGAMNERWLSQDAAAVRGTAPLSGGGMTTWLNRLPAGMKRQTGKETAELVGGIVTSSLSGGGMTTWLSTLPAGMKRQVGKVTSELIGGMVTSSLRSMDTFPLPKPSFIPKSGMTTPYAPGGGATTPFIRTPTNYMSPGVRGIVHPAGMLPSAIAASLAPTAPMKWKPPPRTPTNWKGIAASAYATGEAVKTTWNWFKKGTDYDVNLWRQTGAITTDIPQMGFGGEGLRGGPGGGRGTPFGPIHANDVIRAMYNGPDQEMLDRTVGRVAGVSRADYGKIIGTYGVRGGWMEGAGAAASASMDADLRYKDFWQWTAWQGKMTQMGYSGTGSAAYGLKANMKGAVGLGGVNNIAKSTMDETINATIEQMSSYGGVANAGATIKRIGEIMGGADLPAIRMGTGVVAGMAGAQQAFGDVQNNPYLFGILGDMYKAMNGNLVGTPEGWKRTIGASNPAFASMIASMKGMPFALQQTLISKAMAIDPTTALPNVTNYLRGTGAYMGKGRNLSDPVTLLTEMGVFNDPKMNPLLVNEIYGRKVSVPTFGPWAMEAGPDSSLWRSGDIATIMAGKHAEGASLLAAGIDASDLATGITDLKFVGNGLINALNNLSNNILDHLDALTGRPDRRVVSGPPTVDKRMWRALSSHGGPSGTP